uniref:Myosin motor domain-containing protein n=1 Tax=Schistocephalus solidus TaxID=70667 RepID=A0A183SBW3_SCHSO
LGPLKDIVMDDYEDFQTTVRVFDGMRMSAEDKESLFAILGGILHLGNIIFDDGSAVQSEFRLPYMGPQ